MVLKFKNKVLKAFPNAKPIYFEDGVKIMSGDDFIAQEYYFPTTNNIETAWEYAAIAIKVTQNFNRTHPLKVDMFPVDESKLERIRKRKK